MQQESLDYRRPSSIRGGRPVRLIVAAALGGSLFVASLACCIATWDSPRRFIFLPAGDVAMGFRSSHGWLDWIEYAEWSQSESSSLRWSVPWLAVFSFE